MRESNICGCAWFSWLQKLYFGLNLMMLAKKPTRSCVCVKKVGEDAQSSGKRNLGSNWLEWRWPDWWMWAKTQHLEQHSFLHSELRRDCSSWCALDLFRMSGDNHEEDPQRERERLLRKVPLDRGSNDLTWSTPSPPSSSRLLISQGLITTCLLASMVLRLDNDHKG